MNFIVTYILVRTFKILLKSFKRRVPLAHFLTKLGKHLYFFVIKNNIVYSIFDFQGFKNLFLNFSGDILALLLLKAQLEGFVEAINSFLNFCSVLASQA